VSNIGRNPENPPQSAAKSRIQIEAMPFAKTVARQFKELETGYREGLYKFFVDSLTSYKNFRNDPTGYKELLKQENISGLREKPDVQVTSRLILYYLTGASNGLERNTAGKYARVVDHLYENRLSGTAAADYVRDSGGMDAVLKKARGHEAPKAAVSGEENTLHGEDQDSEQGEEPDDHRARKAEFESLKEKLFDPKKDISIRVTDDARERVLGSEISMLEVFYLECRKTGLVGRNGVRIQGRLIDPPSE
jgi:hypothetical protein